MGRIAAALVIAICLSGCSALPADRVQLLTGVPPAGQGGGCYTYFVVGRLVVDPEYGTAFEDASGGTTLVMWLPRYSARRAGSEVEVLDPAGNVLATTGRRYQIEGAYVSLDSPDPTNRVLWACGFVIPCFSDDAPAASDVRGPDFSVEPRPDPCSSSSP